MNNITIDIDKLKTLLSQAYDEGYNYKASLEYNSSNYFDSTAKVEQLINVVLSAGLAEIFDAK